MAVELKDIVVLSGHSGLFKVVKQSPHGLLVEHLDAQRKRTIKHLQHNKISTLEDICIYTTGKEDTTPLSTLLWGLYAEFSGPLPAALCDTPEKLHQLLRRIIPEYDQTKVYTSNIKKMVHWYNRLVQYLPELFEAKDPTEETATS